MQCPKCDAMMMLWQWSCKPYSYKCPECGYVFVEGMENTGPGDEDGK